MFSVNTEYSFGSGTLHLVNVAKNCFCLYILSETLASVNILLEGNLFLCFNRYLNLKLSSI